MSDLFPAPGGALEAPQPLRIVVARRAVNALRSRSYLPWLLILVKVPILGNRPSKVGKLAGAGGDYAGFISSNG